MFMTNYFVKEKQISWAQELDEAAELSEYAVEARYPGLSEEVSEDEYKKHRHGKQKSENANDDIIGLAENDGFGRWKEVRVHRNVTFFITL